MHLGHSVHGLERLPMVPFIQSSVFQTAEVMATSPAPCV